MLTRCPIYLLIAELSLFNAAESLAGPPFKTDDPQPVDYLHWEFYVASMQQFERQETDATLPHFEVNYGVVPNVQLHLVAPFGYVHTVDGTRYGYGDTELGVKYRFIDETADVPQIGTFPLIEIPTGNEDKLLGSGKVQAYIPLWAQKSWGGLTTYAGGGVWYNPGVGRRNWGFAGWEVQYDFSQVITLGAELYYQTPDNEDAEQSGGLNLGGYINLNQRNHILFSFGRIVSSAMATIGYIGYQLTV